MILPPKLHHGGQNVLIVVSRGCVTIDPKVPFFLSEETADRFEEVANNETNADVSNNAKPADAAKTAKAVDARLLNQGRRESNFRVKIR